MNITINQGTTEAIVDIEDILDLLKYKLDGLQLYKAEGVDITQRFIDTQKSIIYLEEYLLSIYREEE